MPMNSKLFNLPVITPSKITAGTVSCPWSYTQQEIIQWLPATVRLRIAILRHHDRGDFLIMIEANSQVSIEAKTNTWSVVRPEAHNMR